jgi:tRNA (mo5U34)-methyltransferase
MRTRAEIFQSELDRTKAALEPVGFSWYPYGTLSNVTHLDGLLTGEHRALFDQLGDLPIADIGGADGDLAFFLESLGYTVDLIDYAPTNQNHLAGAHRLREALQARNVFIYDLDLDAQFQLPRNTYGLVVFLGILYHLKNPFYALETLSQRTPYLLVSTRIAKLSPDHRTELAHLPVAYLLAPDESNNDSSNYWIFSDTGLHRLFERTGWEVLDYRTVGNTTASDPASPDGDERAFALLHSNRFSPLEERVHYTMTTPPADHARYQMIETTEPERQILRIDNQTGRTWRLVSNTWEIVTEPSTITATQEDVNRSMDTWTRDVDRRLRALELHK